MKKHAFTLAETLITLTTIGVVAALTIPTLMSKYQEKARITQVKKAFSQLTNAYKIAVLENGSPETWNTQNTAHNMAITHINMANKIIPYLKIKENCLGLSATESSKKCGFQVDGLGNIDFYSHIMLEDGTAIAFRQNSSEGNSSEYKYGDTFGAIAIKLNAKKEENKNGYNIFEFLITDNGLIPTGIKDTRLQFKKGCNTTIASPYPTDGNKYMMACAGWVIYKGNMDYWHCTDLSWDGKDKCSK